MTCLNLGWHVSKCSHQRCCWVLLVCLSVCTNTSLLSHAEHSPLPHLSPCSLRLNVHILKHFIFAALSTDCLGFLLATHEHCNETIFVQQFNVSIPTYDITCKIAGALRSCSRSHFQGQTHALHMTGKCQIFSEIKI